MTPFTAVLLAIQVSAVGITTIARDQMSDVDRPRQAVARTEADWQALWRDHAANKPVPEVDLASRMVVAVFLGSRSSAGFSVEMTGMRKDGAALIIEWRERRPAADAITAQVITTPAHIASVPRFDGEVRFEKVAK